MGTGPNLTTIEELAEWREKELGTSEWLEITQDRVNTFAEATDDHQYIHVDPVRAGETIFGGTIAHGYLTLSLIPALSARRGGARVDLGARMTINYGVNRVRFPAPVSVGSRVRLRTHLLDVESITDSIVQIVYQQTIEIENEDKPACVAETISRLYLKRTCSKAPA